MTYRQRAATLAMALIAVGMGVSARAADAPRRSPRPAPVSRLAPVSQHPNAAAGLAKVYGGAPVDVTVYHYDNYRTGWNPNETDLTPATVKSGNFGLLATLPVDGNVYAQPLLANTVTLPDGTVHSVLIVATGNNSVYAYDAQTYALLWQVNLGQQQSTNDVGCGDVAVGYGITSTPVIVKSGTGGAIYLVAAIEPNPYEFHSMLHALDLTTGQDLQPPVEIKPSATLKTRATIAYDPQNQWSRASLAYNPANSSIYIGIGSHCDNNAGAISGWLLQYSTTLQPMTAFHTIATTQGYNLSSIWMGGFAPAIDPAGNVFVVTGNGAFTGATGGDWGESVLKLNPGLTRVTSSFTPSQYAQLNNGDVDFGSGGVMLLPTVTGQKSPPLAVAMGKSGIFYMMNQNKLGGLTAGDTAVIDARTLNAGLWGGPAYYNGPTGPTVFVQGGGDVLRSFAIPTNISRPAFLTQATGTTGAGYGGSLPIVSSNGATPHTGVVWLVRRSAPIELEAYDAGFLGQPIYSANIGAWSNPYNNNPFLTAMEANGRVYVATYQTVQVFGLTQ